MNRYFGGFFARLAVLLGAVASSVHAQGLPRESVIEVPAAGEGLCVHNLFQSNMVLQRNEPIRIRGWAAPGEKVTVTFADEQRSTTAADDRAWSVELPAMEASSEPRVLVVAGDDERLELENVLVGDVWVLGGQSNMEFPLSRVENGNLEIVSANYPQIRILTVPAQQGPEPKAAFPRLHEWSSWSSRHFRKGDWDVCSPEVVRELSAIGFVFARRLHTATGVPIGVIDVSRGGTTVETWTPDSVLREIDERPVRDLIAKWDADVAAWDAEADLANRVRQHEEYVARMKAEGKPIPANRAEVPSDLRPGPIGNNNLPGSCYAGMIAPLEGLTVKGAIFHQGYNNCFNGTEGARMYRHVFPRMIAAWREAFADPEMPFGILTLCTEGAVQTRKNFSEAMANPGPFIREAQYRTFLDLREAGDENVGFVSTYDLRRRWYHPQLKVPAGERIARWALATQYGMERDLKWRPPALTRTDVEEGSIVLGFDTAVGGVDDGGPIVGFAVAGEDRRFHPADAAYLVTGRDDRGRPREDRSTLVLTSDMVPEPVHFRYAWARSPMGNVQAQGNTDVPLATQRSDDWPLEDVPRGVLGDDPPLSADRGQRRTIQQALQREDLRRRLAEAESFVRENRDRLGDDDRE